MEFRHLGSSGLKVSAVSYGNWITHGSQLEAEQATACVRAALDAGITTFDTADVYAAGRAETILGEALAGARREGLEILTKVYFPTGPGPNDTGLSRKHIHEAINASLQRLRTDYVDLYQAHRYDYATPLSETMAAFAEVVRAGKALYIGVSEWTADQIREAHTLAAAMGFSLVSNQPRYNALYRVIEAEVVPICQELGISQVVFSPMEQGILSGKYRPGEQPPAGSRATHEGEGARFHPPRLAGRRAQQSSAADTARPRGKPHNGSARRGLGTTERQCRERHHRWVTPGSGDEQRRRCGTKARTRDNG